MDKKNQENLENGETEICEVTRYVPTQANYSSDNPDQDQMCIPVCNQLNPVNQKSFGGKKNGSCRNANQNEGETVQLQLITQSSKNVETESLKNATNEV